jgi:hypothetical protein
LVLLSLVPPSCLKKPADVKQAVVCWVETLAQLTTRAGVASSTFHFGIVVLSISLCHVIILTSIPLKLNFRDFITVCSKGCNALVVFAGKNINSVFGSPLKDVLGSGQ